MIQKEINYLAKDAAIDFRRKYDLGQADPIRIDSLLNKLDMITVFASMSDNFSGMAARFEDNGFLLINCKLAKGRQIFTVCHELYHLFVQKDFEFEIIADTKNGGKKSDIEKLADAFAVELLMPEQGIQELLLKRNFIKREVSLEHVIKLEQYFQVSRRSMVYRLKNLGFIPKDEDLELKYFTNVKESASRRGYDVSLYEPTNPRVVASDYYDKAELLYRNDKIGLTDFAQLLNDIGVDLSDILDDAKNVE